MNYPGKIIKKGEANSLIVEAVQNRLNQRGFGPLGVDGDFGTHTESAVKAFQALNKDSAGNPLVVDGKLGPISWAVLFGVDVAISGSGGPASALLAKVLEIAAGEIGVAEVPPGSNRGVRVEMYLRSAGCQAGDPWCASFVYWCFGEAARLLGTANPLVRTGSCMAHWSSTSGKKIPHSSAMNDPSKVKPGQIFIINHGNGRGHTGIVRSTANGFISTIEGNTSTDGGREGLCVAELERKILSINAGFIDYAGG